MNILLVGGAGYLGGALTDLINDDIRVYDNLTYENEYRKPFNFIYGDILNHDLLKKHLDWADTVVWLAAIVGDGACELNKELSYRTNQYSVEWLANNFNGRIVFTSTCSVFGANQDILDEKSPTNPLSTYAITKLNAENYLKNKNAFIFRLGTLFGISDIFSRIRLDLVVNTLTAKAHFTNNIKIFGGEQYRPLLHVQDAAKAIIKAIYSNATGIHNIHCSNEKIIDIAHTVQKEYPNIEMEITEQLFKDSRNYKVNSDKVRSVLNWEPHYNIYDGVYELKQLFTENRIKNPDDERYSNHLYLKLRSCL